MSLFQKSPAEIRKEVEKIAERTIKQLDKDLKLLKQESVDFQNLMNFYTTYFNYRNRFLDEPNQKSFDIAQSQLNALYRQTSEIKSDAHKVEHMIKYLKTILDHEQRMLNGINRID